MTVMDSDDLGSALRPGVAEHEALTMWSVQCELGRRHKNALVENLKVFA